MCAFRPCASASAQIRIWLNSEANRRHLLQANSSAGAQPKVDSLSGLPLRVQAEHALDTAIQSGGHGFVVAFIIDRVHLINARFGYGVGDQILTLFRQHLAEHLEEGDQLFRWTGPVFLALIDRPSLPEGVRAEVKRVTSKKLETTVQIGSRFVLLPVSSSALIISLLDAESAALSSNKSTPSWPVIRAAGPRLSSFFCQTRHAV